MLRVSNLRKLVKLPSAPCREILVDLLGTEVGAPVSRGLPADILEGTVVATGAGYDFTNAALSVTTAASCPESSELTFSITGTGPIPSLRVGNSVPEGLLMLAAVTNYRAYALYNTNSHTHRTWVLLHVLVSISEGAPYELKFSIADNWVGVWLNGTRIARADVDPGELKTPYPWIVDVGRYIHGSPSETYTGHVDSVRLAYGALPDIDVL